MKTELVALRGMVHNKAFNLAEGARVVIGRGQEADIQILDVGLSRSHCAIEKAGDDFYIADLGSLNGTRVNGELVTRRKLAPDDVVAIGGIEFQFRCSPDRRRTQANLVASVPEKTGPLFKQRVEVDRSELMELPSQFQSIENYRRIQRDLATIYRIGNMISGESDIARLHTLILDAITQVISSDRTLLILADPRTGKLSHEVQRVRNEAPDAHDRAKFSTTIVNECFKEGASILRANALTDEMFGHAESVISQNIHSVLCVPIETPDQILGVLYADTVGETECFTRHDLELLAAVGKQAGVAIQRAQFAEQLRRVLYGSVGALVATIEAKDEYTRGHSDRVTQYALLLGRATGMTPAQMDTLQLAGFLHDVGKIGVPEHILRKPGPLTAEEYEIVKQHPQIGFSIVKNIEGAETISEVVLHHHERWDGRGYPDGLAEDRIPLSARVLAVADAFDAMTSRRPYRQALAMDHVMREITQQSAKQFDPALAEAFLKEVQAGHITAEADDEAS